MANPSIHAAFERMWQHIIAKIGTKADTNHNHDDVYYTEVEIDTKIGVLNSTIDGKAEATHNHDDVYYTEVEIDEKIGVVNSAIDGKADESHNHDDVYYTEVEVDEKLEGKADASHTHTVSNITDLTVTATELNYMKGVTSNVQPQINTISNSVKSLSQSLSRSLGRNIDWTGIDTGIAEIENVAYGNGVFVLLPYEYAEDLSKFAYSFDGRDWISIDAPIAAHWADLIFADNKFVAIGQTEDGQNIIALSTYGTNWTVHNIAESGYMQCIAYGNGRFVIGGTDGLLISSVDCIDWLRYDGLSQDASIHSMVFAENAFFAYGYTYGSTCFYSTNGVTWSERSSNCGDGNVVFANGIFVNACYGSVSYSNDGINWNNAALSTGASWNSVCYADGIFVVLSAYNSDSISYSYNGVNWNTHKFGFYYDGVRDKIAYGNGKFIVASKGSYINIISFGENLSGFAYNYDLKCLAEKCENNNPNIATFDKIRLRDSVDGCTYFLQIVDGTLVTTWAVSDFRISNLPTKLDYDAGEEIDISGLSVELVNDNGTAKAITDYTYYPTIASGEAEDITIEYSFGNQIYSETFTINSVSSYNVAAVDEYSYGFSLNDDGYYESENQGVDNSYAICKVLLNCSGRHNVYLDCINYAEGCCDYGILSNVDQTLQSSYTADSDAFYNFGGKSMPNIQTVDYGVLSQGEHFIYVKFRKDGSVNNYNDSLQFKVRFE